MECEVCLEQFNDGVRRPKILPCGHTFCAQCVQRGLNSKCPVDRKAFQGGVRDLPDNFALIRIATGDAGPSRHWWCQQCKKAADPQCLENHPVCCLKALQANANQQRVDALQQSRDAIAGRQIPTDARQQILNDARQQIRPVQVTFCSRRKEPMYRVD